MDLITVVRRYTVVIPFLLCIRFRILVSDVANMSTPPNVLFMCDKYKLERYVFK